MNNNILEKAQKWLSENYDVETREKVEKLIAENSQELTDAFYKNLEFGTGGMRGIMGVGTNRINKYTLGVATQGFSNYLLKNFPDNEKISVVVSYDNRNNSRSLAELTAQVFAANGMKVFLFNELHPTPLLSFAVRHLKCQGGVMLTASHNPKEYNGYKAYWEDGAQVIPPHDKGIIEEVNKITEVTQIKFDGNANLIEIIDDEIDKIYLEKLKKLSLSSELIKKDKDFKIVFSPLHGTAVKMVPAALKEFGFNNVITVPEQNITSGDFPTVKSPNPENAEALTMALKKAEETNADMVAATDPDADRVGIAVRNNKNEFVLLNGNQTASVLIYYLLKKHQEKSLLKGKEYIVKTIVTTELLVDIAKHFGVEYYDTLTGFKYIAELLRKFEGQKNFIGGGEESYGYLASDFVRDKDAIMSVALIAEAAVWAKSIGKSFYEILIDIYVQFGFYREVLVNLVKQGKKGEEEIKQMMNDYQENPPKSLGGNKIVLIKDYKTGKCNNIETGEESELDFPKSNVLQFFTTTGDKITVRPSGTEPKIKFYIGLKMSIASKSEYSEAYKKSEERINKIKSDLSL